MENIRKDRTDRTDRTDRAASEKVWWEPLLLVFLFLYPLRHINWGLDFWDTGYNYANFLYMGLEHMDSMWLFSTYLANAAGHLLTMLPGAGGLAMMNFYTGFFVSGLAMTGYFFCTRKLEIPRMIVFIGEFAAVSLCWCPTALLYNYLTYVLFLGGVILLYKGLTEDKMWSLFAAGVCLGSNVLVRFSNLPEAAMIVAVWAWDIIVGLERRRRRNAEPAQGTVLGAAFRHTLWCLGGYLAALAVLLGYIHIRYGLDSYVEGIFRLFAMTDNAQDYKATSMLMGLVGTYVENLYWAVRIGAIIIAGIAGFAVYETAKKWGEKKSGRWRFGQIAWCSVSVLALAALYYWRLRGPVAYVYESVLRAGVLLVILLMLFAIAGFAALPVAKPLWCAATVLMLVWLYARGFCSFEFNTYNSILRPGILFLMLTMLIGAIRIFHPGSPKEEKLISGMVILVVLLTSIGSNNGVYPSLNNLFVAAPYTLWQCWRFLKLAGEWRIVRAVVRAFPVKAIMAAFLLLFLFQSAVFGACFVFAEATGVGDITSSIENNEVLTGIHMSPERAQWMSGLSEYVKEKNLKGREVILFGQIPSISYYMQMPSAFNPWSDLRSYGLEIMEQDLQELEADMETGQRESPVIIMDWEYVQQYEAYLQGGREALRKQGVNENRVEWIAGTEGKYKLLKTFAIKYNYDLTYKNEKFSVYETSQYAP